MNKYYRLAGLDVNGGQILWREHKFFRTSIRNYWSAKNRKLIQLQLQILINHGQNGICRNAFSASESKYYIEPVGSSHFIKNVIARSQENDC